MVRVNKKTADVFSVISEDQPRSSFLLPNSIKPPNKRGPRWQKTNDSMGRKAKRLGQESEMMISTWSIAKALAKMAVYGHADRSWKYPHDSVFPFDRSHRHHDDVVGMGGERID